MFSFISILDQGVVPDPVPALDAAPGVPVPDLPDPAAALAAGPDPDLAPGPGPASPAVAVSAPGRAGAGRSLQPRTTTAAAVREANRRAIAEANRHWSKTTREARDQDLHHPAMMNRLAFRSEA